MAIDPPTPQNFLDWAKDFDQIAADLGTGGVLTPQGARLRIYAAGARNYASLGQLEVPGGVVPQITAVRLSSDVNGQRIDFDTNASVQTYGHDTWTSPVQDPARRSFDLTFLAPNVDVPVTVNWMDGTKTVRVVHTGGTAPVNGRAYDTLVIKPGSDGPNGAVYKADFESKALNGRKLPGIMGNSGPEGSLSVTFGAKIFPGLKYAIINVPWQNGILGGRWVDQLIQWMNDAGYPDFVLNYAWESDMYQDRLGTDSMVPAYGAKWVKDMQTYRAREKAITGANQSLTCFATVHRHFSWLSDAGLIALLDLIAPNCDLVGFDGYDVEFNGMPSNIQQAPGGGWLPDTRTAYEAMFRRDWTFWKTQAVRLQKRIYCPEIGLWNGPGINFETGKQDTRRGGCDNPDLIDYVKQDLDELGDLLYAWAYFEQDPDRPHRLLNPLHPKSLARFAQLFS